MRDTLELRRAFLRALRPPQRERLSEWAKSHLRLPAAVTATPGPFKPWAFQTAIMDAMTDPDIERVTVLKSVRVGYSQSLVAVNAHYALNDPTLQLMVFPTQDDSRNYVLHSLQPAFDASPSLRGLFTRTTVTQRSYPGGNLKIVSASTPRNLRGHTARVLLMDEVDAFEVTDEGDPIRLAINRTLTFDKRKIVMGSTPIDELTSPIWAAWCESDQRVFEIPCPDCGHFFDPQWSDVRWQADRPETAMLCCPGCGVLHDNEVKNAMVTRGRWRATRPEIAGHAGFKLTSILSPLANAALPRLAAEFLVARRDPVRLKAWTTTILAQPWREATEELTDADLMGRREPFDLDSIPPEVMAITSGVDVQHDRIELTTLGWTRDGVALVLAHERAWGSIFEDAVWAELDGLLERVIPHPGGGVLRYEACLVDAGDGSAGGRIHAYCRARIARRIFPCKGIPGFGAAPVAVSERKNTTLGKVILVGVDRIKREIFAKLSARQGVRFTNTVAGDYFEQLCSERLITKYSRGQPIHQFERIPGRRAETLDCLVYAMAARHMVNIDFATRETVLTKPAQQVTPQTVIRSRWLDS